MDMWGSVKYRIFTNLASYIVPKTTLDTLSVRPSCPPCILENIYYAVIAMWFETEWLVKKSAKKRRLCYGWSLTECWGDFNPKQLMFEKFLQNPFLVCQWSP